jgi:hypothetical protein
VIAISDAPTRVTCAETARPLWRYVLDRINARRQRQADRVILRSLCHPRIDDDFRVEFERRLMGQ